MDTQVLSPEAFVKKYGKPDVLCNDELMTADLTALLAAERDTREWIETKTALPKSGLPVIAFVSSAFGNTEATRRIRASYADKFTLESGDDEDFGEYDEKTDAYYCPPGWYETNEFEDTHWAVDGEVTHWMFLPAPPIITIATAIRNGG